MRELSKLSDDQRRTIYEGDLCRTLAQSDGYKLLVAEAQRALEAYEHAACRGMASWDDYQRCVGIMEGIRHVLNIVPSCIDEAESVLGDTASDPS